MAEEITAPREDSVATMRELRKYTPKLSPAKPRQPLIKFSVVKVSGTRLPTVTKISALGLKEEDSIQNRG